MDGEEEDLLVGVGEKNFYLPRFLQGTFELLLSASSLLIREVLQLCVFVLIVII